MGQVEGVYRTMIAETAIEGGLHFPSPNRVIYAGASPRRTLYLAQLFSDAQLELCPTGEEPVAAPLDVAWHKVREATKRHPPKEGRLIIAADTQTLTLGANDRGCLEYVRHNKPTSLQEVHDNFAHMRDGALLSNGDPTYLVESATVAHLLNGTNHTIGDKMQTIVTLDPQILEWLLETDGFQAYLREFQGFYSGPPYSNHGMHPITPLDLSGGISLPVLVKMGVVDSVSGVLAGSEDFREAFTRGLHTVAVGVSPRVLQLFDGQKANVDNWQWLSEVVDRSINK